jgi:O-antigen/teichoic acid export membrane protein
MLLRQTLLYLPAQLVGPIFQFVSLIAWTHVLSPREMGVFALISIAQELAYTTALFWFSLFTVRYFVSADPVARARFLDTESAVIVAASVATAAGTLLLPLFIDADWTTSLLSATAVYVVSRAIAAHFTERARTQSDTLSYSLLQGVWPILGLLLGFLLVYLLGPTASSVLWGYAIAQIVSVALVLRRMGIGRRPGQWSRELVRAALVYGVPLFGGALLTWVASNGLRLVIEWRDGAAAVGLVTVGWALGVRAAQIAATLTTAASFPLAIARGREQGMAAGQAQLEANSVLMLMVLAPATSGLWAIGEHVTHLLIAEPYQAMTIHVLPMAIAAGALRNFRLHCVETIFLLRERPMMSLFNDGLDAVLTVALCIVGLWMGGLTGAVAGAAAAAGLGLAITQAIGWHMYRFGVPIVDFARIGAASLLMVVAVKAMPLSSSPLSIAMAVSVGAAVYGAVITVLYPEAARKLLAILRGSPARVL